MEKNLAIKDKLNSLKSTLPGLILEDFLILRPDQARAYTDNQKKHFRDDIAWIISFLAEAVWAGQPALFEEFVLWLKTFLASVNVPMKDLSESLGLLKNRIGDSCTNEENAIINPILEKAMGLLFLQDRVVPDSIPGFTLSELARTYLENILRGDRKNALSLILHEIGEGTSVRDIYLMVFQPVQYEIGHLWQTNKISVAQEHFCTGATQLIMSQLYPYLFTGEKKNRKMITTCVAGELHEIGARMVTDFFEMEGWDTYYLGANMPVEGLIKYLLDVRPQLLAISATMTTHVSAVAEMIRFIRSVPAVPSDLKIMVGGYPFIIADGLWKKVGADIYAPDAMEAVLLANKLFEE